MRSKMATRFGIIGFFLITSLTATLAYLTDYTSRDVRNTYANSIGSLIISDVEVAALDTPNKLNSMVLELVNEGGYKFLSSIVIKSNSGKLISQAQKKHSNPKHHVTDILVYKDKGEILRGQIVVSFDLEAMGATYNTSFFWSITIIALLTTASVITIHLLVINSEARRVKLETETASQEIEIASLRKRLNSMESSNKGNANNLENVSKFVASICHELKTPITNIISYIDLKDETLPKSVRCANHHIQTLIDDLSSVNELHKGNFTFHNSQFELRESISDALDMTLNSYLPSKKMNMKFITHTSSSLPDYIVTDRRRFEQIIINLVTNAIKYSKANTVSILANSFYIEDKAYLELSVVDDGEGISETNKERILEDFTRINNESIFDRVSNGIGLALTKTFVEKMQGSTYIFESVPSSGFGLKFRVPIKHSGLTKPDELAYPANTGDRIVLITKNSYLASYASTLLSNAKTLVYPTIDSFLDYTREFDGFKAIYLFHDSFDNSDNVSKLARLSSLHEIQLYGEIVRKQEFDDYFKPFDTNTIHLHNGFYEPAEDHLPAIKVLAIEDSISNSHHYHSLCSDFDYSLQFAYSVEDAFFLLNAEKFDIVLIDTSLEGVSWKTTQFGYDVALMAFETINSQTPFVAVTNTSLKELVDFFPYVNIQHCIDKSNSNNQTEKNVILKLLKNGKHNIKNKVKYDEALPPLLIDVLDNLSPDCKVGEILDLIIQIKELGVCSTFLGRCERQIKAYDNAMQRHLIPRVVSNIREYFHYNGQ